jgi:hypothetical protein
MILDLSKNIQKRVVTFCRERKVFQLFVGKCPYTWQRIPFVVSGKFLLTPMAFFCIKLLGLEINAKFLARWEKPCHGNGKKDGKI